MGLAKAIGSFEQVMLNLRLEGRVPGDISHY